MNQNHNPRITFDPLSNTLHFQIHIVDARCVEPIWVAIDAVIYGSQIIFDANWQIFSKNFIFLWKLPFEIGSHITILTQIARIAREQIIGLRASQVSDKISGCLLCPPVTVRHFVRH